MRFSWLFIILLVFACERTDVIDKDMVNLYADLRVATLEYTNPSEVRIARQNLMRQAGYSAAKFAQEINNIRANPELWVHFQQAVVDRLDTLRAHENPTQRIVVSPPKPPTASTPIAPLPKVAK